MDYEADFKALLAALGAELGVPASSAWIERRCLTLGGYDVRFHYGAGDPEAFHIHFDFGICTPGRTLTVYRLMLESNLLVYAQDQAQMGVDNATGAMVLLTRVSLLEPVQVQWLAETLLHYLEHGRYWREKIMTSPDEMFEGIGDGDYAWIRI